MRIYVYTHIYTYRYRYRYMCVHVHTYCLDVSIPFCVYLIVSRSFCGPMFISFIHHFFHFFSPAYLPFLIITHVFHCISSMYIYVFLLSFRTSMAISGLPWHSATATAIATPGVSSTPPSSAAPVFR